jgi:hypothetical protein
MQKLGAETGWLDVVVGENGVQAMAFYDKSFKGFHAYGVLLPTFSKADNSLYTEWQLERILNPSVKAFGRMETSTGKEPTYLAGVRAKW